MTRDSTTSSGDDLERDSYVPESPTTLCKPLQNCTIGSAYIPSASNNNNDVALKKVPDLPPILPKKVNYTDEYCKDRKEKSEKSPSLPPKAVRIYNIYNN